jgi:cell division protein FtsZ
MEETLVPANWELKKSIIKVIGVGGGGTNAVSYMYNQKVPHVDYVVCNSDFQHLNSSPVPNKLQLGPMTTKGLGCGTDPLMGRKAAVESKEEIERLLSDETEMVFITCGMGGGTGTGAAPLIAEIAKAKNMLTVGVVTLPFRDEGPEFLYRAKEGIKELNKFLDSLLIIDNEKIYEVYGKLDIFRSFPKADEVLATAVRSIAEIITSRGFINVDFADVRKVMKDSGMALMGIGAANGPDRCRKAVDMALTSPLLNGCDVSEATRALVNIASSSDEEHALRAEELSEIMDYIKSYTGETSNFKRGVVQDDSLGDKISVTIIATGFAMNLPFIDENAINKDNIIVVDMPKDGINYKSGMPLLPTETVTVTRRELVEGVPALVVSTGAEIARLESEPAYYRRDRTLKEQKAARQSANENLQI